MISLTLLGMLLTCLFTSFLHSLKSKNEINALKEKVLSMELFQLRLDHLFEHFTQEEDCFLANLPHIEAVGSALFIYCDHGIDPDPAFSGRLHNMLFKTRDSKVCLCYWSSEHKPKVETLLTGVQELAFEFFNGKKWQTLWPKNKKDEAFPLLVKISILLQGKDEKRQEFFYSLPPNIEIKYSI